MPTRIELLRQAGFPDDEIGNWANTERLRMRDAGFTDRQIDEDFGITRPPAEIPAAFIERLKQGNWLSRILGTAGEYAQSYFGDAPLGFSPEHQRLLGKFGIIGDLTAAAGGPADALLRSVPAAIAAVGGGLGQLAEEGHDAAFGPGPYAKGKAARDFAQLAQFAALLSAARGPQQIGPVRAPPSKITNGPIAELPRAQDFRDAAASIAGNGANFTTEQKLLRLWTDHGIPPVEVAADALRDRTIAEAIKSDSGKLPEAYVGGRDATALTDEKMAAPARAVEPDQSRNATAPVERTTLPTEREDGLFSNPEAPEPAQMIAESKDIQMYNPPRKRPRPFSEDYGTAVGTDAQGRLVSDIEGRPLRAEFVAGRRFYGKRDHPLSPDDIKSAIEKLDIRFAEMPSKAFRQTVGGIFAPSETMAGPTGDIFINKRFSSSDRELVTAHEFSHAIDHFARRLSQRLRPSEIYELRSVYGTMRSGMEDDSLRVQPEDFGYRDSHINSELLAEGLRAYMADPNYFKMMAPKTAARIRAAVNESPYLKDVIQFNSLGAAGLIGAGARDQDRDDQ